MLTWLRFFDDLALAITFFCFLLCPPMNDRFEHQLVAHQSAPLVAGAQPTATLHLLPLPLDTFPYQACVRVRIEPVYTLEILLSAVPDNAADVASASYPPAWSQRDDHPHSALFPASSFVTSAESRCSQPAARHYSGNSFTFDTFAKGQLVQVPG